MKMFREINNFSEEGNDIYMFIKTGDSNVKYLR